MSRSKHQPPLSIEVTSLRSTDTVGMFRFPARERRRAMFQHSSSASTSVPRNLPATLRVSWSLTWSTSILIMNLLETPHGGREHVTDHMFRSGGDWKLGSLDGLCHARHPRCC